MQNIKNFTPYNNPDHFLISAAANANIPPPALLRSDSGHDWYECQRLFADDTIKIQYDSNGIIRAVVDAPVPERGNTYAVSVLWPANMSVAEIAIDDYPAGVTLDGTWKFDGVSVYQDSNIVDEKTLAANTVQRDRLMLSATLAISAIQCSASVGKPRDADSDDLLALQQYVDQLRGVDLNTPVWPTTPTL